MVSVCGSSMGATAVLALLLLLAQQASGWGWHAPGGGSRKLMHEQRRPQYWQQQGEDDSRSQHAWSDSSQALWPWLQRQLKQVPQQQPNWGRQQELSALVQDLNCKPSGIAVAGIARMGADSSIKFHLDAWLASANRRAYSSAHNTSFYVATHALSSRHPSWDKIVLADVILQHSCPEWIWLLDMSDAFIMNMNASIASVIDSAVQAWRDNPAPGMNMAEWADTVRDSLYPDAMVAKDCRGVNAGSLIIRNTPWGRRHLAELWATNTPEVPMLEYFWEQAAIMYLLDRKPGVRQHYHHIEQHLINAYPGTTCGQTYQEGDIAVHMPGEFKQSMMFESGWLNKVPLHAHVDGHGRHNGAVAVVPRVYHVVPVSEKGEMPDMPEPHRGLPAGPAVGVAWERQTLADGSAVSRQYQCLAERRHLLNPGWPIPEPPLVSHITAAYRSEVKLKTLESGGELGTRRAHQRERGRADAGIVNAGSAVASVQQKANKLE